MRLAVPISLEPRSSTISISTACCWKGPGELKLGVRNTEKAAVNDGRLQKALTQQTLPLLLQTCLAQHFEELLFRAHIDGFRYELSVPVVDKASWNPI